MSGDNEQLENNNNNHNESVNEVIIIETSNDSVQELSDDDEEDVNQEEDVNEEEDVNQEEDVNEEEDENDDLIDLSSIIEGASDEDIDDLRIIFKTEKEDTNQNSLEVADECNTDNLECTVVNPISIALGKNLKRKQDDSLRSLKNQPSKLAKVSSQNHKFPDASESGVITFEEFSNDLNDSNLNDSAISIKQEVPASSFLSISCSSIKSGSECPSSSFSEATSTNTTKITSNGHVRKYDYDLSRIKWLRPLSTLSSPAHLQIVIIDRNNPHWRISNDKWLMIEKKLLEHLHDEMLRKDDTSIGLFDGAKWTRGIKVVGCGNHNSLDFITQFMLNKNNLWPGANLDVIPINQITRHTVRVFIPPPELSKSTILSFIKLQNPLICSDDWEIIKERKCQDGGRHLWISINTTSNEYIRRSNGEIKFGINRIWLRPSHQ